MNTKQKRNCVTCVHTTHFIVHHIQKSIAHHIHLYNLQHLTYPCLSLIIHFFYLLWHSRQSARMLVGLCEDVARICTDIEHAINNDKDNSETTVKTILCNIVKKELPNHGDVCAQWHVAPPSGVWDGDSDVDEEEDLFPWDDTDVGTQMTTTEPNKQQHGQKPKQVPLGVINGDIPTTSSLSLPKQSQSQSQSTATATAVPMDTKDTPKV